MKFNLTIDQNQFGASHNIGAVAAQSTINNNIHLPNTFIDIDEETISFSFEDEDINLTVFSGEDFPEKNLSFQIDGIDSSAETANKFVSNRMESVQINGNQITFSTNNSNLTVNLS